MFATSPWRRGWDLNPRWVAPQWFSRPSDSAALAPLLVAPAGAGHERVSVPTGPSGPAAREELAQQVGGGLDLDAHGHRALVVEPGVGEEVVPTAERAGLEIGRAVHDFADA